MIIQTNFSSSAQADTLIRYARGQYSQSESFPDAENAKCEDSAGNNCTNPRPPLDMPLERLSWIDSAYSNETAWPKVRRDSRSPRANACRSLIQAFFFAIPIRFVMVLRWEKEMGQLVC